MYNLNSEKGRKIKLLCLKHRIRIREITSDQYLEPLGYLAGFSDISSCGEVYQGRAFDDEMLIFQGFDARNLNLFLGEFPRNRIQRVALKAVLTPDNIRWSSLQLYEELKKEHEALQS